MLEISVFALDHAVIAQRQLTASDTHRVLFDVLRVGAIRHEERTSELRDRRSALAGRSARPSRDGLTCQIRL